MATMAAAPRASAQTPRASAPVLARIDSLVAARDSARAKTVVDSVLADTDPSSTVYPGALYRRGALAGFPAGRTDLLRLIVDFPLHDRVSDALYLLAEGELATDERDMGAAHLERIVRDFAGSAVGPRAAAELARLRMAQGRMADACTAFDSALAHIPASDVERHRRVAYDARPCDGYREAVADSIATAAAAAFARDSAARDSVARRRTGPPASRAAGRAGSKAVSRTTSGAAADGKWSVQVAAYGSPSDASRLMSRLKDLGYAARVSGDGPFRVRVGRYQTLAAATAMVTRLKAAKFTAIVVDAERP
ncbi:MAG TPA: SPOR domain-containing protein [Gemmatimonadaceae bacterium]|nr:SPOR domain-containing protein [Gemmatimonadaceae bacterium]